MRDRPDELIRKIRLTPWARAEYELSLEPCEDEVERARRFFVASWMSMHGGINAKINDMRMRKEGRACISHEVVPTNALYDIANRFLHVQIEKSKACNIILKYMGASTLIYLDPPYLHNERSRADGYIYEWTDEQHGELAWLVRDMPGYVIVSGYACPLYTELYEAHGWHRVDKEAQTNSGGKRIESLWLSPRTVEALGMPEQLELI
jgi:DNA adenine methylase